MVRRGNTLPPRPTPDLKIEEPEQAVCTLLKPSRQQLEAFLDTSNHMLMQYRGVVFGSSGGSRLPSLDITELIRKLAMTTEPEEALDVSEQMAFAHLMWSENIYAARIHSVLQELIRSQTEVINALESGELVDGEEESGEDSEEESGN
jgi:hypothetical protein